MDWAALGWLLLAFNVGLRRKFSIIQATAVATNDKDHEWNMATTNDEGKQQQQQKEEEKEAARWP